LERYGVPAIFHRFASALTLIAGGSSSEKKKGTLKRVIIQVLDVWYQYFENHVNCGFGLSLIAVAEKVPFDTSGA
jgi:hypothetical protein